MFKTLTGTEYLKAEIACKHDKALEKGTWEERLNHFDSIDMGDKNTFKKASNPIGLRAAVEAYKTTLEGDPTGYLISLDACSSGLQILSLLVSCPKSYSLCGGVSDQCVDSYVKIYDSMNLHGALTRKEVKNAIMTSLYGSTAMPEMTFGDNVDMFYDTMEDMAPGAWDLNLGLQELWNSIIDSEYKWVLPDNFHAHIETKMKEITEFTFLDNDYTVSKKIAGRPDFHKGLGPNLIHSIDGMVVREMIRRCMFDKRRLVQIINIITGSKAFKFDSNETYHEDMVKLLWSHYKETGFLSARILDHIDSDSITLVNDLVIAKMIQSMPDKPFDVVTVHDCFRCHPNYGNDLRRQYNIIMADINDSTILTSISSQVTKKTMKAKKVGVIPRKQILEANYMLA